MGEFEFTYKLNDTIQRSLFTRTLDYEIEELNRVIDSSSISWVNDCEFDSEDFHIHRLSHSFFPKNY